VKVPASLEFTNTYYSIEIQVNARYPIDEYGEAGLSRTFQALEAESIHILREVVAEFAKPVMLYSIGKSLKSRIGSCAGPGPSGILSDLRQDLVMGDGLADHAIQVLKCKLILNKKQSATPRGQNLARSALEFEMELMN
jgi:hypothetical protein